MRGTNLSLLFIVSTTRGTNLASLLDVSTTCGTNCGTNLDSLCGTGVSTMCGTNLSNIGGSLLTMRSQIFKNFCFVDDTLDSLFLMSLMVFMNFVFGY